MVRVNRLFEQSDLKGQLLWNPQIDGNDPAPDLVIFIEELGRVAVTFVSSLHSVEGTKWYVHDSQGRIPTQNPLEKAWRAATAVREILRERVGIGAYTIPLVVFTIMCENTEIIAANAGRKVRIMWGLDDLAAAQPDLPEENEIQPQLSADFIEIEVAALCQQPPEPDALPASSPAGNPEDDGMDLSGRTVIMHHVDQVVINIGLPS